MLYEVITHFKTDIFKRVMWYSTEKDYPAGVLEVSVDRVIEVIRENKKNNKVERLVMEDLTAKPKEVGYSNVMGEDSLTRFDESKPVKRKPNNRNNFV